MSPLSASDMANIAVAIAAGIAVIWSMAQFTLEKKSRAREEEKIRIAFLVSLRAYLQACQWTLEKYKENTVETKAYAPRNLMLQGSVSFEKIPLYVRNSTTVRDLVQLLCQYGVLDKAWGNVRLTVESCFERKEPMAYDVIPSLDRKDSWQVLPVRGSMDMEFVMRQLANDHSIINVDILVDEALGKTRTTIVRLDEEIKK